MMYRTVCFTSALVAILSIACSKTIRVPPASYAQPGSAAAYHIKTVDDREFNVARYSVSDSVIVVEEWAASAMTDGGAPPALPFEIQLQEIESIDRVVPDRGKSSGWVLGAGVAVFLVSMLAASLGAGY
jgi:hypothetical protein